MVEFIEDKKNEFPKDKLGSSIFLTSLRDFQKDGVEMGVEKVGKLFPNSNDATRCKCAVQMSILGEMPKCRVFKIDEEANEYITEVDEMTGEEKRVLDFEDVSGEVVTFYLNLKKRNPKEDLGEETLVQAHMMSSAYPLIRAAFELNGDLKKGQKPSNIVCSWSELKEAMEGMIFIGKYKFVDGKFKYAMLDVEIEE